MKFPVIEVKNLNHTYHDGRQTLKNISFLVNKGETIAILGPNGAGKTTLLHSLCGLTESNGEINLFKEVLTPKNIAGLRKKMSYVFQNPNDQLFMPTVALDIAFGLDKLGFDKQQIKQQVTASLAQVGLSGYEERNTHHLSYGEKKRVCLAVALARNAELVFFDEPTNEFDPYSKQEFAKFFNQMNSTRLMITHDVNLVLKTCEKVLILNQGNIVDFGETRSLLSNSQLMESNRLEVPYGLISQVDSRSTVYA